MYILYLKHTLLNPKLGSTLKVESAKASLSLGPSPPFLSKINK